MTDRDPASHRAPHSAASWVDEVLKPAPAAPAASAEPGAGGPVFSGPQDLKLPGDTGRTSPDSAWSADDWVAGLTGGPAPTAPATAPAPLPARPARPVPEAPAPAWDNPAPTFIPLTEDVGQKKLTAGLLAIFLGGLGVHKFYLGLTNPGLVLLGVNVGVWLVAVVLGLMMFIVGLGLTLPLAASVSSVLSVVGVVEGIIYLTKSDAEFQREYLIQKKPWF